MSESNDDVVEGEAQVPGQVLLRALVALLVDQRESDSERTARRKTEVLLADAGLRPAEIAPLIGKKVDAVRKTISRARAAQESGSGKSGKQDG